MGYAAALVKCLPIIRISSTLRYKRSPEDSRAGEREIAHHIFSYPASASFRFSDPRISSFFAANRLARCYDVIISAETHAPSVIVMRHEVKGVARPRPEVNHSTRFSPSRPSILPNLMIPSRPSNLPPIQISFAQYITKDAMIQNLSSCTLPQILWDTI